MHKSWQVQGETLLTHSSCWTVWLCQWGISLFHLLLSVLHLQRRIFQHCLMRVLGMLDEAMQPAGVT